VGVDATQRIRSEETHPHYARAVLCIRIRQINKTDKFKTKHLT
jgi:hypothetical protein